MKNDKNNRHSKQQTTWLSRIAEQYQAERLANPKTSLHAALMISPDGREGVLHQTSDSRGLRGAMGHRNRPGPQLSGPHIWDDVARDDEPRQTLAANHALDADAVGVPRSTKETASSPARADFDELFFKRPRAGKTLNAFHNGQVNIPGMSRLFENIRAQWGPDSQPVGQKPAHVLPEAKPSALLLKIVQPFTSSAKKAYSTEQQQ